MLSYLKNERLSIEPYVDPTDLPQKYVNLIPVISGSPVVFAVGRWSTDLKNNRLLAGIN